MDNTSPSTESTIPQKVWTGAFVRHYVEMVAAMVVGMVALHPVAMFAFPLLGWSAALSRPEVHVLVMATNMSVAMALWMRYRGHRWLPIAEMTGAMYLPFVVLFLPLWGGAITATTLFIAGHLLMLPVMLGVMLLHPSEYSGHQLHSSGRRRQGADRRGHARRSAPGR